MTDHRARVLRIERTFDAPVARVFEAWTSEEVLRRWLHGMPGWDTPTAEVDLRVGGTIRIVMRDPSDGTEAGATGEYRVVEPARRLIRLIDGDACPQYDGLSHLAWDDMLKVLDGAIAEREALEQEAAAVEKQALARLAARAINVPV